MAEKDIAENTFVTLNDVFADILNVLLFRGKQIITADLLQDMNPVSQYRAADEKLHKQERDTHKLWHGHGFNLILFGIENQTKPDRDMPFRVISYDGASYRNQLLKTEERLVAGKRRRIPVKKRYPVITIVLYFGKKRWNYPKNICDSFYPTLPKDEVTEALKEYIQDYKVHVFDIPHLTMEEVKLFRSDFRIVADYFVHAYTDYNYTPDEAVITHVDEFLKLMRVLTGDRRYEEISKSFTEEEREAGIKMCNVLDAREARGEARGMANGIVCGENRMGKLISLLLGRNMIEEAKEAASDEKVREKYYTLYNI